MLLALLFVGHAPRPAPAREEPTGEVTQAEVDRAIERGAAWLAKAQRADGSWAGGNRSLGTAALGAYTLAHCGVVPRVRRGDLYQKALARAMRRLDKVRIPPSRQKGPATYTLSLMALTLRELDRDGDRARLQAIADRLAGGQAKNGQWHYDTRGGGFQAANGDNSNTQFAILALGAAHAEGLRVPREVLERSRRWWISNMKQDGGFGYGSGGGSSATTGSMTAAALSSLRILAATLEDRLLAHVARKVERRLGTKFRIDRNEGSTGGRENVAATRGSWTHYYMWSVERAMVLGGQKLLNGSDWYEEGARMLLDRQHKKRGHWVRELALYDTCFALLFLTRAADPRKAFTPGSGRMMRPVQPLGPVTGTQTNEERARVEELADHLSAGRDHRVLMLLREHGTSLLWPVARHLLSDDEELQARVLTILGYVLPPDRVDVAKQSRLARGRLVRWIRRHGPDLVQDESGRFHLPQDRSWAPRSASVLLLNPAR